METAKFVEQRRRQMATWKAMLQVAIKTQDAQEAGYAPNQMELAIKKAAERQVSGKAACFGFRF